MQTDEVPAYIQESRKYLDDHHVILYMEDAVSQFFLHRQENPKLKSVKFLREYFRSLQQGGHILFREFDFIRATPYNRCCVLAIFLQTYKYMQKSEMALTAGDYLSLLRLLWPDFPSSIIEEIVKNSNGGNDATETTFKNFLYTFQIYFCLQDFVEESRTIFATASREGRLRQRSIFEERSASKDTGAEDMARSILESFSTLCETHNNNSKSKWPSSLFIKKLLLSLTNLNFNEFKNALIESEEITKLIGKLPPQSTFGVDPTKNEGNGNAEKEPVPRPMSSGLSSVPRQSTEDLTSPDDPKTIRAKSAVSRVTE